MKWICERIYLERRIYLVIVITYLLLSHNVNVFVVTVEQHVGLNGFACVERNVGVLKSCSYRLNDGL